MLWENTPWEEIQDVVTIEEVEQITAVNGVRVFQSKMRH